MGSIRPVIGQCYEIDQGQGLEVIAVGTHGVIVEYTDGRVELMAGHDWQDLPKELTKGFESIQQHVL